MAKRKQGDKANLEPVKIIETALRLMARHGFSAMSMQMVADSLGVSQSTIMHYFKNKMSLFQSVLNHVVLSNHQFVTSLERIDDDALTRLRKHFAGNLKWAESRPDEASVILLFYYMGSVHKEYAELYREILAKARERILHHVLAARRENLISMKLDPRVAAEILHENLLAGLLNRLATQTQNEGAAALNKKWNELFAVVLNPAGKLKSSPVR